MEGFFYASTVIPYKKVRYGPSKGEIYLKPGITRMQQNLAYWQTYWQSMGWLFLVICCLTLINCAFFRVPLSAHAPLLLSGACACDDAAPDAL